jgi:putative nucleotidyltransferase with HDIG domain
MLEENELEELKSNLKEEFSGYYEVAGGRDYRYAHLETVRKMALNLLENIDVGVDEKVLEISALYHDIGRKEDIEDGEMDPFENPEGHAERGAELVGDYVSSFVSENQFGKIKEVIRNHHSEAETAEGKILKDANKLSNFGVSDLWRQFQYASIDGSTLRENIDYFWESAVEEYEDLINELHFEHSREVARKRLEKHKKTFKQIEKEI